MPAHLRALLCAALLCACGRGQPSQPALARKAESKAKPSADTTAASVTTPLPPDQLVLAIGDLHGDLSAARAALRLAGAIDQSDRWIGGKRIVVQTGDVLDRGDDEPEIVALFERLRGEAKRAGGALLVMSGNHEVMNVAQDFRYVTPEGHEDFAVQGGRAAAFAPNGPYARIFAQWPIIRVVGDTVFAHGGVLPKHARYGIDRINREAAAWMLGKAAPPELLMAPDAPIWTRVYSSEESVEACALLTETLTLLNAKRMVVGHTVQERGISSACDGRVFRIDVGLARFYRGPTQVLELHAGEARVIAAQP